MAIFFTTTASFKDNAVLSCRYNSICTTVSNDLTPVSLDRISCKMSFKLYTSTILSLFILISITAARQTLELKDFGPCLLSLNHFGRKSKILNELVDQLLAANRKSVLKIKIVNRYPKKMEKGEPLAKCTLYVVFTPESNADWEKVESAIFTCTFAYRPDYVSAVILLRPRQFSPPKLTGCKYKTISIRIFSLAVALSYRKVTNIEWSFHCYLCSGRTWISFIANAKMSEIVRLNHLTLRDRLDPKKTFFYIYTAPAPRTNRISGCQYPIWRNPKNPCHPYLMVQEVLTSNLNVTFRNIRSFSDHQCGLLHLNRILMNGTVKWNATGSLKFRQAIVSRFKYCKFGRSSKPGTIQFWAWVTPYKWHVWVVLLLFMVACTMAITASDYNMEVFEFLGNLKMSLINNLFIMIGIHLRQAIGTQSWLKWVIHLTMILTLAVYETYFTSMVVVPSKVEDNPGFASLLKNGYKMVYYRALANVSARVKNYHHQFLNLYAYDFEKLGISGWIKNRKYFYSVRKQKKLTKVIFKIN